MIMYSVLVDFLGRCGEAIIIAIVCPLRRHQKVIFMILKLHLLRRCEWMILYCLIAIAKDYYY